MSFGGIELEIFTQYQNVCGCTAYTMFPTDSDLCALLMVNLRCVNFDRIYLLSKLCG